MKRILLLFVEKGVAVMAALFLFLPMTGRAGTFTVSNVAQFLSALSSSDVPGSTNSIIMNAGTYTLTSSITFGNGNNETLTITTQGGAVIIQGPSSDRILTLNASGSFTNLNVSITGVTFENGNANDVLGGGAILAGGPGNTTIFNSCIFQNNKVLNTAGNADGGAIHMSGGGAFTYTNCTFTNNSTADGNGGALAYFVQTVAGSLTVTGCTFSGNSVATFQGLTIGGGAISISAAVSGGVTSPISIAQNTFLGNTDAQGSGGAINIEYIGGTSAIIQFNRFYQNTAGSFPDVAMVPLTGGGNVDISDNWWGRNISPVSATDPHAGMTGAGGSGLLIASTFIELTNTDGAASVCGGSGGSSATVTAGFTKDNSGTTIAGSNLTAFVGVPISLTATHGTLSGAPAVTQSNGTATATLTANITPEPPGSQIPAIVQSVADSVSPTDGIAESLIEIHAPSLATGSTSGSVTASASDLVITDASCNQICFVVPSGAAPVSGTVNGSVTVDPSVQTVNGTPYVVRHYDISPSAGASTATATITLYFLQSDFNSYNSAVTGAGNMLPTSSSDATGKANLTITQYHGTGTAPGNYTGWAGVGPATVMITPGASNVVWNASDNWWEVTFNVTGFSGFFVTGPVGIPLPVRLESFSGLPQSGGVLLTWKVGVEEGMSSYEVDGSTDGVNFVALGSVAATGASSYQYFDADGLAGDHFYRLRMVNTDGTYSYSNIVLVKIAAGAGSALQVLGNPVRASCTLRIVTPSAGQVSLRLTDVSGKVLWQGTEVLGVGANTVVLPGMDRIAQGVYVLSVEGQVRGTVKVVKE